MKNKKKNFLITSTNISFWSKKNINYLVGDWCITEKIKTHNYKIIKYHGLNKKKLVKKNFYLFKIYLFLIKKISLSLNKYHNSNFSKKYWEILISRWLWHFIMYTYDRWEILNSLKKFNKKFYINKVYYDDSSFINNETRAFIHNSHSPLWNDWIFSHMFKYFPNIKYDESRKCNIKSQREIKSKINDKKFYKKTFLKNKSRIFIKNLFLAKKLKVKINLTFRQYNFFNYFSSNYVIPQFKTDFKRLDFKLLENKSKNNYLNFLNAIVKFQIPRIFLEGLNETNLLISNLNWPVNPKIILTSVSHLNDDIFKFYLADKKKNSGSKLFVFQHGGGYIYDELNLTHILESRVADKFFTWGCKSKEKNIFPLFVTSTAGKIIKKNKNKRGLLIIVYDFARFPHRLSNFLRTYSDIKNYITNLDIFITHLNKQELKNTKIKLRIYKKEESILFQEFNKKIIKKFKKIDVYDNKKLLIFEESVNYSLVVETTNNTNFLECINLNIPIILLWNKNMLISKPYKIYYKKLEQVKIIHKSPKQLAEFINKTKDIQQWWNSKEVQRALKFFRDAICRSSKDPLKQIVNLIKNEKSFTNN